MCFKKTNKQKMNCFYGYNAMTRQHMLDALIYPISKFQSPTLKLFSFIMNKT